MYDIYLGFSVVSLNVKKKSVKVWKPKTWQKKIGISLQRDLNQKNCIESSFFFVISDLRAMNIVLGFFVFVLKVLNVLGVILQKFGIKLLRITKEKVLKGKLG